MPSSGKTKPRNVDLSISFKLDRSGALLDSSTGAHHAPRVY